MTRSLSPHFQRALAVTILVAIIAAIYYAIAQPLIDTYAADRSEIKQQQEVLARYLRTAGELPVRQKELAALNEAHAKVGGFLNGTNDTLVATQIQNRIKTFATAAKAELKSSQVLPAAAEGKLMRIGIRDQISTTTAGLLAIFHDLEAQSPILFLDNIILQVRPPSLRDLNNPGNSGMIDVQFDVYGYSLVSG